jgi:hypothetical protein
VLPRFHNLSLKPNKYLTVLIIYNDEICTDTLKSILPQDFQEWVPDFVFGEIVQPQVLLFMEGLCAQLPNTEIFCPIILDELALRLKINAVIFLSVSILQATLNNLISICSLYNHEMSSMLLV